MKIDELIKTLKGIPEEATSIHQETMIDGHVEVVRYFDRRKAKELGIDVCKLEKDISHLLLTEVSQKLVMNDANALEMAMHDFDVNIVYEGIDVYVQLVVPNEMEPKMMMIVTG
jgi:hypothetical protein